MRISITVFFRIINRIYRIIQQVTTSGNIGRIIGYSEIDGD